MSILEMILYPLMGIGCIILIVFMFKPSKKKKKEADDE